VNVYKYELLPGISLGPCETVCKKSTARRASAKRRLGAYRFDKSDNIKKMSIAESSKRGRPTIPMPFPGEGGGGVQHGRTSCLQVLIKHRWVISWALNGLLWPIHSKIYIVNSQR